MKVDKNLYYLVDHLVKTISLPDFIEAETDQILKWSKPEFSAKCHCPMPDHHDKNASFHVTKMEESTWIFHCFGCGKKGTIIHFCVDYFGLRNKLEAILFLCKKFDIKNKEDIIIAGIKNISKKVDVQRKMESANIVTSNQCRMLLRKNFDLHKKWVWNAYKQLNTALEEENEELIEKIGYEASKRMREII